MAAMERFPPLLVTGAAGTLGTALKQICAKYGFECHSFSRSRLDITDSAATESVLTEFACALTSNRANSDSREFPDRVEEQAGLAPARGLVINCAAYTDEDRAEEEEELAFAVNARGAANVATAAARHGLDLIHVSTDYVFDGVKQAPYAESDEPHPLNAYGRTKLAGEQAVAAAHPKALIVRTSWLYGPGGTNFPDKIITLARRATQDTDPTRLEVVGDQYGSPTAAVDLAWGLLQLYSRGARGLFHLAGSGSCSRYELAKEVLAAAGLEVPIVPVSAAALPTRSARPPYSVLDCSKAAGLGVELPPWRESVRAYVREHLAEAAT